MHKQMFTIGCFRGYKSIVLSHGKSAMVYKGYNSETFQPVAIKVVDLKTINNQVTRYLLDGEKKALETINNPYVCKGLKVVEDENYCYMIMEYYDQGTLQDYILKKGQLKAKQALELFNKILMGYIAVADNLFIHRDLKTQNIMIRKNGDPAIIDFGYCEMMMGKRPPFIYNVGSPSYMAPQSYFSHRYSQKSDIWSLGVIFYEMLTGKTPDHGKDIDIYFRELLCKKQIKISAFSQVCKEILSQIFIIQAEKRATVHRLKYLIDKSMMPLTKRIIRSDSCTFIPSKVSITVGGLTKKNSQQSLKTSEQSQTTPSSENEMELGNGNLFKKKSLNFKFFSPTTSR